MTKPRIILADTDSNYIVPLQYRFAEDFFERVDLEIITSREYFEELFSAPQKADILIVSENLYDSSLHRHNIGKLFLMTEQYGEGETDQLNVNRIFKYTSIKEIFNEIIGKSANILKSDLGKHEDPQIIAVYSAAGGTGKTTVALGMAACLTHNYKKVLYINASWLQTFQRMLRNQSVISAGEVYSRLSKATETLYGEIKYVFRKELFTYLPPFKASLMSLGLPYSVFEKLAISAKRSGDFDFIIVDTDTEFDEEKASLLGIADRVIIVTRQQAASVYATNTLVANINGSDSEKYIFICNDFNKDEDNALISPSGAPRFTVSEYVEHISHYDNYKAEDLLNSTGIRKACYLIL